jgi:hypothetical protein
LYKYLLLLFLLLSVPLYAQTNDTIRIITPADTLNEDILSAADSIALSDTLGLLSDSLNILVFADTIRPIYQRPLYGNSIFINREQFTRRTFSYTGDIFSVTPFFFDVSPGLAGHPANMLIYGTGSSLTSFLVNGINYNDYSGTPFDLNRVQEEYIDSAEVIPLPRGFLYGAFNNPAAVNFIGRDFISVAPYTKIKYYEGPYGEGFIDGMFNSIITGRMNLFVEVTNRKADQRFLNTDYGRWNARIQLKYLLNNNINFLSGYDYSNTYGGAPGGINIFNLDLQNNDFYDALYSEIGATVVYPNFRFNTSTNSVFLKSLGSFGNFSFTDFTLYYRFNRIELNQPANIENNLDNMFRNKISGLSVNQHFNRSIFNLNLIGSLERVEVDNYQGFSGSRTFNNLNFTNLSLAGIFSVSLFDSLLHPSAFYKVSRERYFTTDEHSGFGADISARINEFTTLYAGYSETQNRFTLNNMEIIQTGIRYSNIFFKTSVNLFSRKGKIIFNPPDTIMNFNSHYFYPGNTAGVSIDLNIHISRVQLEGKVDYYRENNNAPAYILPDIYAAGGLYYRDSLFSGNLDLKTGFNLFYYGRRNINLTPAQFAIFRSNTAGPDLRLDFFISGEIQNRAIVFFTLENLLNTRYFIIPFYPMPPAGVRFGVNWELFN